MLPTWTTLHTTTTIIVIANLTSMQLRLKHSATFSKRPLNFTMYLRPLVKRPQRISTEKMFFFKNGMLGSSSQVKWCLQTKYQLLTRNLKICDGHPITITTQTQTQTQTSLSTLLLYGYGCWRHQRQGNKNRGQTNMTATY